MSNVGWEAWGPRVEQRFNFVDNLMLGEPRAFVSSLSLETFALSLILCINTALKTVYEESAKACETVGKQS